MKIWVDADACPKIIKEILFRAATRAKCALILVANQPLYIPPSQFIKIIKVSSGFDVADNYIVQHVQEKDLVITADIPLADAVVTKGGIALNPRGKLYDKNNIKESLAYRNLGDTLRSSGIMTRGPSEISKKEIQNFANALDQFLCKHAT